MPQIIENSFADIPGRMYALRVAVDEKRTLPSIKCCALDVVAMIAHGRLLGTVSLVSAIDELGSCIEILLASPWTETLFPPVLGLRAALLSRHPELRLEEGPNVRALLRRGIVHLDRIPIASPSYPDAMGNKALLLTGKAMLDEADRNVHGAVNFSAQAVIAARSSQDDDALRLTIHSRARVLSAIGEFAAANALLTIANDLPDGAPARVWLSPDVWGLNPYEGMGVLAA